MEVIVQRSQVLFVKEGVRRDPPGMQQMEVCEELAGIQRRRVEVGAATIVSESAGCSINRAELLEDPFEAYPYLEHKHVELFRDRSLVRTVGHEPENVPFAVCEALHTETGIDRE